MSPLLLLTACLVRRVRGSLSGEFDVSKVFTRDLCSFSSSLISSTSHLHRKQRSVWVKAALSAVCWVPQVSVQQAEALVQLLLVGFRMLVRAYFQGKVLLFIYLFREAADSFDGSLAPRPVQESRCVMCHFLNRWGTCHMPLRVLIQYSLMLWESRLKASPGKKERCYLLGEVSNSMEDFPSTSPSGDHLLVMSTFQGFVCLRFCPHVPDCTRCPLQLTVLGLH